MMATWVIGIDSRIITLSLFQCPLVKPQSPFPSSVLVSSYPDVLFSSRDGSTLGDDYKLLHRLGEGAYGTVVAALHKPSGRQVAIKKVLPFEHTLFCLRTLRELKLLRFFSETCVNENVCFASRLTPMPLVDEPMLRSSLSLVSPSRPH